MKQYNVFDFTTGRAFQKNKVTIPFLTFLEVQKSSFDGSLLRHALGRRKCGTFCLIVHNPDSQEYH